MRNNINIDKEFDALLNSAKRTNSVGSSPFFTTQVLNKIEARKSERRFSINWSYVLKPAIAAMMVLNLANAWIMLSEPIDEISASTSIAMQSDSQTYDSDNYIIGYSALNETNTFAYYEEYLTQD